MAEIAPGELMLNMRDNRGTGRAVYTTKDMGRTWMPHVSDGRLVEPVCMASLLKVRASENALKQDILLFSNPADAKERKNITIQMSLDGGKTWTTGHQIHAGPAAYSDIVMVSDTHLGVFYENGASSSYEKISFVTIPVRLALTNVQ